MSRRSGDEAGGRGRLVAMMSARKKITFAEMRFYRWLSKVTDSLAAGCPFSIVHLLVSENWRLILFK